MDLYFDTGRPIYNGSVSKTASYLMQPELASVNPLSGNPTGTKLYAKIPGVGIKSRGTYTITNSADEDICHYTYWTGYSDFVCFTKNATYTSSILKVKNITSGVIKQC